jgi:hypothetical protein
LRKLDKILCNYARSFALADYRRGAYELHQTHHFLTLQPIKPPQGRLPPAPGFQSGRAIRSNSDIRFHTSSMNIVGSQVETIVTVAQAFKEIAHGKLILWQKILI